MIVTFCGHGKNEYSSEVENKVSEISEKLIKKGASEFLLGGYGAFDMLAARVILNLKKKYPHIKSTLVIPYLNRDYETKFYDSTVYPELENVYPKIAILKRNRWMVDMADVVVCYVRCTFGGAYMMMQYAEMSGKNVLNIARV